MTGPKRWPEGAAVAAVAMDGGVEHTAQVVKALGAVKQRIENMGR